MKKLLNTLFVTSEDAYLTLDGENVVVNREKQVTARFRSMPSPELSASAMQARLRRSWAHAQNAM